MHLPNQIETGQDNLQTSSVTLDHGSGGRNRFKILIIRGDRDVTLQMSQRVKDGFFTIPPMDEYKEITDIYSVDAGIDLGCNQILKSCNDKAVNQVKDNTAAEIGMPIQEAIVVLRNPDPNNWRGWAFVPSRQSQPSKDTYAVVGIPERLRSEADKLFDAAAIAHEFFHSAGGYKHAWDSSNEDDVMEEPLSKPFFNSKNAQFLRELKALVPGNYWTPEFNFKDGVSSQQSAEQVKQLSQMEIRLPAMDIPTGAKWLKFLVQQEDGPAVTMIYGDPNVIEQFINGYVIKGPQMSVGDYVLLPDQQVKVGVSVATTDKEPEWGSSDWNSHKAWPDLTVASNQITRYHRTPKADSTTISHVSLGSGEKTADATPTLVWNNTRKDIYYYEVQLSGDPDFEMDPEKAKSFVYGNLIHGGMTSPTNSWTVPDSAKLPAGRYYWRVRPRIQGSGTPVDWSSPSSFDVIPAGTAQTLKEMHDLSIDNHVINPPTVRLDERSVEGVLLNREQRRKLARSAKAA